ncbi:MAG: hypothetical protein KDI13_08915 [Alphaproteobacteria bacterium]|nr:hypothetical protein [Alphaproteobacteria bacterium]
MAKVGAQRAAVLTGKSKSTIQRAMNSGKLSFELDANDRRVIDVSELERVFGIAKTSSSVSEESISAVAGPAALSIEYAVERERLRMQIKMLEAQLTSAHDNIDDLKEQRDKWEKQASQVLITSQYSQRQAEELRAEIRERDERAKARRVQQQTATKPTTPSLPEASKSVPQAPVPQQPRKPVEEPAPQAAQSFRPTAPGQRMPQPTQQPQRPLTRPEQQAKQEVTAKDQKIAAQMKKLKAENENVVEPAPSMFRFWKRAKG